MSVEAHHSALTQFHWCPPQSWSTWSRAAAAAAALAAEAVPLARQEPTPLIRWTNKMTEISSAWHIEDLCIICLCFGFFHFQSCQYLSRCKRKHAHSTYYLTRLWKRGDIVHHVLNRPWKSFKCCSFAVHVIVRTLSLLLRFHFCQTHVLNVWPVVGCVRKTAFSWLPDLVIVSFFFASQKKHILHCCDRVLYSCCCFLQTLSQFDFCLGKSHLCTVICLICVVCLHILYLIWSHCLKKGNVAIHKRWTIKSIMGTLISPWNFICLFIVAQGSLITVVHNPQDDFQLLKWALMDLNLVSNDTINK